MSQSEQTNRLQSGAAGEQAAKKPYHKPEVRYEKVFETSALTCGKVQTTQGQCHSNRKNS
jgi:hypothetical protein